MSSERACLSSNSDMRSVEEDIGVLGDYDAGEISRQ